MTIYIRTIAGYLNEFPVTNNNSSSQESLRSKALECALDIRKFEIDLYWKRANYFWTLITATFGAYFLLASSNADSRQSLFFLDSCIGLILSTGWYLVNRGSKFWQENWERHVDILENEIIGPLLKAFSGYTLNKFQVNKVIALHRGMLIVSWLYCRPKPLKNNCILNEICHS